MARGNPPQIQKRTEKITNQKLHIHVHYFSEQQFEHPNVSS